MQAMLNMGFYVDLMKISLDDYREILMNADLLPSRMLLKDNIDAKFDLLKKQQIETVDDLRAILKNKKRLHGISEKTGISIDYLKVLIREVNSYRQKPIMLNDIPGVTDDTIKRLNELNIRNALHLYERVLSEENRRQLSKETGVTESEILRITRIIDLSRIRWVNHTFAYVLLEAGYDSPKKVAEADYNELYSTVKRMNEEREIYKGHIGLHDMKLTVAAAQDVSLDIQY
jgi:hypothetical protein